MTWGFEVFVQLVMAAMTTLPSVSSAREPSGSATGTRRSSDPPLPDAGSEAARERWKVSWAWSRDTRSCGRDGPARLGTTVERSSDERLGVDGFVVRVVPEPLFLGVDLDEARETRGVR